MKSDIRDALGRHSDRERLEADPVAFDREILGLDVPPFHEEADRLMEANNSVGFARALHEIVKNRNIRIIIGSKSMQRAMDLVRRITWELENNDRMIELWGTFKDPNKWSATQIQVTGRDMNLKEATVTATGLGGNIEGVRGDIGILDDPIDIEDVTSEVERVKGKRWLDNTFLARLEPEHKAWVVGTRWHPEDIYSHIAQKPEWKVLVHRAVQEDGSVLWPERWPIEKLMEKKAEIGQIAFEARYMNNPQALVGVLFKVEWLQYVDDLPENLNIYQGWDLAISTQETADYTACMTIGIDEGKGIYLLDLYRDRLGFPSQTKAIKAQAEHLPWRPRYIAIESNAYQRAAAQHLQAVSLLPVVESKAVGDKTMRIQGMSPYFETGRMKLWRGMRGLDAFVSEFVNFPYGSHDDTLDALWHALQQAMKDTVRDPWIEVDMGTKPTAHRPWERR
jgi:predicted phage terminase large subunit-like protein